MQEGLRSTNKYRRGKLRRHSPRDSLRTWNIISAVLILPSVGTVTVDKQLVRGSWILLTFAAAQQKIKGPLEDHPRKLVACCQY